MRFTLVWYHECMIVLLLIAVGLALGSFVNAFVWRLHKGKDWVRGRSECVHCHHKLAAKDLVPVLSWLSLRGKCRYCGKPIADSPIVELAVPALFVLSYYYWPMDLAAEGLFTFVLWLVFIVGFVVLATYDLKWFLLPDKVVFPLMGLAAFQVLGVALVYEPFLSAITGPVVGAALLSGLFFVLHTASRGSWIGFGDVKLAIVLGLLAGGMLESTLLLFVASVLGMVVALPLMISGKATRRSRIPFGPFLLAGMLIVQLFGGGIIDWYAGLFVLA